MELTTFLAIFFVVWWIVLFTTLPWGVRTADEAGLQQEEGFASSAPVKPMLWRKMAATTIITIILVGGVHLLTVYGIIDIKGYLTGK